jgi:thiol:disulfide interchange protein DsbD
MNSVKVVLGFLELALALKFLSVSDMTSHWGILKYELFMGLWILIFAVMTAYLMGWFRFPHDSPMKKRSTLRTAFATLSAIWTLYLATGFLFNEKTKTYQSLSLLSGLAPAYYRYFTPLLKPIRN